MPRSMLYICICVHAHVNGYCNILRVSSPVYSRSCTGMWIGPPDLHGHLVLLPLLWRENTEEEEEPLPCLLSYSYCHSFSDQSSGCFGKVQLRAHALPTIVVPFKQPELDVLLLGTPWCHHLGH